MIDSLIERLLSTRSDHPRTLEEAVDEIERLTAKCAEWERSCDWWIAQATGQLAELKQANAEIERLHALHLKRTKDTHKILLERDEAWRTIRSINEDMNPIQADGLPVVLDDNI